MNAYTLIIPTTPADRLPLSVVFAAIAFAADGQLTGTPLIYDTLARQWGPLTASSVTVTIAAGANLIGGLAPAVPPPAGSQVLALLQDSLGAWTDMAFVTPQSGKSGRGVLALSLATSQ